VGAVTCREREGRRQPIERVERWEKAFTFVGPGLKNSIKEGKKKGEILDRLVRNAHF